MSSDKHFQRKKLHQPSKMTISARKPLLLITITFKIRSFSTNSTTMNKDFAGKSAYDVLGVSETSSSAEIKASFRKLAKETHPDLCGSSSESTASQRFVQILAAYEILSHSERRAHYDMYLFAQKRVVQKHSRRGSAMHMYESYSSFSKEMEVVEWLKWYRYAINDIVSHKKVVVGSGYFDKLEGDFYSAIHAAYYGPVIESMDLLPDCFEAEERSVCDTPEVLHLVSGRDHFGIVSIVNKLPELSNLCCERLTSFASLGDTLCKTVKNTSISMDFGSLNNAETPKVQMRHQSDDASDVYKDLELHISGTVVAMATRIPPKSYCKGIQNEDSQDHIHIFLSSNERPNSSVGSRIQLGTIAGLGTNSEEGSCDVYSSSGAKTHVIMKHRTLLVKHMHWYQVGDKVSVCECRCSRARLPPSKFWLFEPRSAMHDVGGWYVETFGRDKKNKIVPSQRHWDGFDVAEHPEKRLHPAMYLLTLAYRTLDLEEAKRRKLRVRDIVEPRLFSILRWCKRLV